MSTRTVAARFFVDWHFNGSYDNESQYLISANGDSALSPPGAGLSGSSGIVSAASFILRNPAGRFSALRSDGALYSSIRDGKLYHAPCYCEVSLDNGATYSRVFTGVLKLPSEETLTTSRSAEITLDARGVEESVLQRRLSMSRAQFAAFHDAQATEADIISYYLQAAGVSPGSIVLDPGMYAIDWSWLDDESPVDEAWSLAAACGGNLYADADGTWRYENMAHWQVAARSRNVQLSIGRGDYGDFSLRYDDANLYNEITVEASPRAVSGIESIWEPEAAPVVPPQSTIMLTARFDSPLYAVSGVQFQASDLGGNSRTADVAIVPTYYAQRADLQITNASGVAVRLYPLRILGTAVTGAPEIEETRTSAAHGQNSAFFAARGTRTRAVRGNPYVQRRAHAGTLAQMLLDQSETPRLIATVRGARGYPPLRLSDRVRIADAPTITGTLDLIVTRIDWSYNGQFQQTIEGAAAGGIHRYDNDYFIVGTHAIGGTRRIFY